MPADSDSQRAVDLAARHTSDELHNSSQELQGWFSFSYTLALYTGSGLRLSRLLGHEASKMQETEHKKRKKEKRRNERELKTTPALSE